MRPVQQRLPFVYVLSQVDAKMDCSHHLCSSCFDRHMKSEKILTDDVLVRCEVCLKSQRITSLSHYARVGLPDRREPLLNKYPQNMGISNGGVDKPREQLYCFSCNCQTFTAYEYLRGQHKHHRVKTYPQAQQLLKEQHLKSMSVLQCKCEQLLTRQHHLQQYMKQLSGQFLSMEERIVQYYDRIQQLAEEKKLAMLRELGEQHRTYSKELAKTIDGVHHQIFEARRLIELLKAFSFGTETINRLVQHKHALGKMLQLQTDKGAALVSPAPRLVEVYDLHYHLQNSLKVVRDDPRTLLEDRQLMDTTTNESTLDPLSTSQQHFRRTVKLVEKVRHKLNSTYDIFGY